MVTTTEAADIDRKLDKQIDSALQIMRDMKDSFAKGAEKVCRIMADMDEAGREKLVRRCLENGAAPSRNWLFRIEACAARGLVDAKHLYDVVQVIGAVSIIGAKSAALQQIADPNHEFLYVDDTGTCRSVQAAHLSRLIATRVWDKMTGAISRERQEKALKLRIGTFVQPSDAGKFGPQKIKGAVFGEDEDGEAIVEFTSCPKDAPGLEERRSYRVAELRRYIRGV